MVTEDVVVLFDEVRLLWHRLVEVGEALHAREPVTLGMRAVLEFLLRSGPSTVPHMARSRHVTRQHIQTLVNGLAEGKLVRSTENPAHRRSSLIALTSEGERAIRRMKERERLHLEKLLGHIRPAETKRAAATLRAVREGLQEKRRGR